jgi:selenocysteine lyase/cysteine desulfurase
MSATTHARTPATAATAPLLPVVGRDLALPVLGGATLRHVNLDVAATAPALEAVAARVTEVLPWHASVHRGAGLPSQVCTGLYEEARAQVAAFVGGRADDVVVLTRNTTDALNLLAAALPADAGDVVVLDLEHHANLLPWRERAHRCLSAAPTTAATLGRLEAALRARPAALVAVTGASNVTGELLPVGDIAALAHAHGARLALDAAQLAPHRAVDIAAWGVDYVALSGHKLYAPFGAGALVGRRDWLDAAPPYLCGGGAVLDVGADGTTWAAAPERHEAGTPNLLGAVALAEACRTLSALDDGALEAHEAALRDRLVGGLEAIAGVTVHRLLADAPAAIGVATFSVAGLEPGLVAAALAAEHAISVRAGRFCAHLALERLGAPEGAVRASLGVGSRAEDVERLLGAVAQLAAAGPAARYERGASGWQPCADDRLAATPAGA